MERPNRRTHAAAAITRVVEEIRRNIDRGVWPAGHRIPTERELEAELGVARNTLRRGLKQLEDEGRIIRHVGKGSFVAQGCGPAAQGLDAHTLPARVIGSSPAEVMEVRQHLEPWAASLAAMRANSAELEQMRRCLKAGAAAPDIKTFEQWDGELHATIIGAARNELLVGLYDAINAVRQQPEWMKLKQRTVTAERRRLYEQQHADIVEALRERDPERAAARVREHLIEVRKGLLGA